MMDKGTNKTAVAQQVVNAIIALQNPRGSTAQDIKKYLVSTGQLKKEDDIKPAILAALKSNKLSRPEGARGRFFFWNSSHHQDNETSSKRRRCCGRIRRKRRCCGRKRRCCGRARRKRRCSKRRRRTRKCSRRVRGRLRGRRRGGLCSRLNRKRDARRLARKISNMRIPSGKQLVIFCAKKKRRK